MKALGNVRINEFLGSSNMTRGTERQFAMNLRLCTTPSGPTGCPVVNNNSYTYTGFAAPQQHCDGGDGCGNLQNFHYTWPHLLDSTYANYVMAISGSPPAAAPDTTAGGEIASP